jgi:RNA polymerase sigma-70 factor (ECF subfamily)
VAKRKRLVTEFFIFIFVTNFGMRQTDSSMSTKKQVIKRAEELWTEYGCSLNRMMLSYEVDEDLRKDLAQNVFLALLHSVERIDSAENPKAYLFRIAHNVATDHIARESRMQWDELDSELQDEQATPAEQAEIADTRSRLMKAVSSLKLPLRQVLTLLLEDFEQEEIANILQISHSNVRVRINRAKQALQEAMTNE